MREKENRTMLQILADWMAKDGNDRNKIFKIEYSEDVLIITRTDKTAD